MTSNPVSTLRLLATCGTMDLSMLGPIADEMERLQDENAGLKGQAFVLKTAAARLQGELAVWKDCHGVAADALAGARTAAEPCEQSFDGPCQDSDGCPTELAVLKRFWREKHALIPPEGPMPSGCAHQWKYFETNETLKGGCGFERCEHCGTERVAKSRRSQRTGGSHE